MRNESRLVLIGNRSFTARTESLSTTSICPATSTGSVWFNLGSTTWTLVAPATSPGRCVGFDLSLAPGEAQLFYIN